MTQPDSDRTGTAWRVAVGSFFSLILSGAPLIVYTQSIFLEPMTRDFGWTRAQYFLPLSVAGMLGAFTTPLVGYLSDRFGVRRILLPGIVLFALSYGALAFLNGSLVAYSALIFCLIFFQGAHGVLLYTKAVALWPAQRPGLLLGITLAGTAVGGILVPPLAVHLIDAFDWRGARLGLAAATLLLCLPMAWAFVKTPSSAKSTTARETTAAIGIPARTALRSRTFWLVFFAIGLSGTAVNALLGNAVALLTDRGFSSALSALALSVIAGAQLVARFCSGLMLDRFPTAKVGVPWFLSGIIGIAIVATTHSPTVLIFGMILVGAGLGAEMELAAYFTRRYFGLQSYGQLYGYTLGFYAVGATSGPLILGVTFDMSGGYITGIVIVETIFVIATLLLMQLGPYVYGRSHDGVLSDRSKLADVPLKTVSNP